MSDKVEETSDVLLIEHEVVSWSEGLKEVPDVTK